MQGRGCRVKGAQGERNLVYHLRKLDYDARRVILTRQVGGYSNEVVPDVIATKDTIRHTFEVKLRAHAFDWIYKITGDFNATHRFSLDGVLVAFGKDFEDVKSAMGVTPHIFRSIPPNEERPYRRILALREWLKGADFLVIRGNNKPFIFIKYWG